MVLPKQTTIWKWFWLIYDYEFPKKNNNQKIKFKSVKNIKNQLHAQILLFIRRKNNIHIWCSNKRKTNDKNLNIKCMATEIWPKLWLQKIIDTKKQYTYIHK